MATRESRKDFFISYTKADVAWAEWIAATLEAAGYTTVVQVWDIRTGTNFAVEMNNALQRSKQIVLVLSRDYMKSGFATSEWVAGFVDDPRGEKRRLLPVRVGKWTRAHPLLKALVYTDLLDTPEEEARQRLLDGLKPRSPRADRGNKTPFPGTAAPSAKTPAAPPADARDDSGARFAAIAEREPAKAAAGHYKDVARLLAEGKLIPFLGLGVHFEVTDPTWEAAWSPESTFFPSTREYGSYLAHEYLSERERVETGMELARVYQFLNETKGEVVVRDMVHRLFRKHYPPKTAHEFLATLNGVLRRSNRGKPIPLIVTTNLDDVLEMAFVKAGEPYAVVSYISSGDDWGRLLYRPSHGESQVLKTKAQVAKIAKTDATIILKLHGGIERREYEYESLVLTEDEFVDYFGSPAATELIPELVIARAGSPRFLFLGYSLRDWNVRFILAMLWAKRRPGLSWAVLFNASNVTKTLWGKRGIEILDVAIESFLAGVAREVMPP